MKQTREEQVITFILPPQARTVWCERRWVCRNGRWVQTNECRASEDIGKNEDKEFQIKGNALAPNQVDILARQALNAWTAAEEADVRRKKAAEDCNACR